jgi:hypothetical protein
MKYIYIIIAFFTFASTVNAQIKIGNTTAPEKFSILEIDALKDGETASAGRIIGGLRLPQWDDAKVTSMAATLTADPTESRGLLVYNKDKQYIQLWNGTKWIALPTDGCTPVSTLTLAANQTTIDEYGATDLVLTATPDANVSDNADIVYRWTLDTNPIEGATGSTYTVKKENLSAAHSGTYQVTAYSCGYTGTISDVASNTVAVTVNPKNYTLTLTPATQTIGAAGGTLSFTCQTGNQLNVVQLFAIDDPERVYVGTQTLVDMDPSLFTLTIEAPVSENRGNRSAYDIKIKAVDPRGNESNVVTVTQEAYIPTGNDQQVGSYFLYGESTTKNATDAITHCRSKVWSSPKRASLMSVDFLTENKTILEATQSIVSAGSYWLMDGSPVMYTIGYTGGNLTLTPAVSEPQTNTHTVRCIAPF